MTWKRNHPIGPAPIVIAFFLLVTGPAPGQTDPDSVVPIPNPLTILLRDTGVHEELELTLRTGIIAPGRSRRGGFAPMAAPRSAGRAA